MPERITVPVTFRTVQTVKGAAVKSSETCEVDFHPLRHWVPLLRSGVTGAIARYADWVVADGTLWRPVTRVDEAVLTCEPGVSLRESTRHAEESMTVLGDAIYVPVPGVTPGWLLYVAGSVRLVIPGIMDGPAEPSSRARFFPCTVGRDQMGLRASEVGADWGPDQDVFEPAALDRLVVTVAEPDNEELVMRARREIDRIYVLHASGPSVSTAMALRDAAQKYIDALELPD